MYLLAFVGLELVAIESLEIVGVAYFVELVVVVGSSFALVVMEGISFGMAFVVVAFVVALAFAFDFVEQIVG